MKIKRMTATFGCLDHQMCIRDRIATLSFLLVKRKIPVEQ